MTISIFRVAPPTARIWVYGAQRALTEREADALGNHMDGFIREWRSHGREVEPFWTLVHSQFLVIGVDETAMKISGCSIDSMFHAVEAFGVTSGLDFSRSGNHVFYRDSDGNVHRVDRVKFSELARQGAINTETRVFDNTVSTLGALQAGMWEVPLGNSWHMKAFGKALLDAKDPE